MTKNTAKAIASAILALSYDDRKEWRTLWHALEEYPSQGQKIVQGEIACENDEWTVTVDIGQEREPIEKEWYADLDDELSAKVNANCVYNIIGILASECVEVLAVGELIASFDEPPPLTEGYKANFATLQRADANGDLALISAVRKKDRKPVALVCAMHANEDDTLTPVPLAVMCEGNPFEDFEDPTA
jgi:hypothetical protein